MSVEAPPLLDVQDLSVRFPVTQGAIVARSLGEVRAVDGVSFQVSRGETLGIVGESGSGKSTLGRGVLQLLRPSSGQVRFDGQELTALWQRRLGRWRWSPPLRELRRRMQIIFQDPDASLDPRMTVESIVGEPLASFDLARGVALRARVTELLEQVGLDAGLLTSFPHELSGGQKQRVGVARALALEPELIVADEPTSALDVSIRAQILELLASLKSSRRLSFLFIAHDLAAVERISDRVMVMYLGRVVELGPAAVIARAPKHPYTQGLVAAMPVPDPKIERNKRRLPVLGEPPSALSPPPGCAFHPRCPLKIDRCTTERPELRTLGPDHLVACHVAES